MYKGPISENNNTKYKTVVDTYEGCCPRCDASLVFAEASFYCPICGYSQEDFILEIER